MGRSVYFSISFHFLVIIFALCNSEPPTIQYSAYRNYEPPAQYTPKYSYANSPSSSTGDIYGSSMGDLGEGGYAASGDDYGQLPSHSHKPRRPSPSIPNYSRPSPPKYSRYTRPLMSGYRMPSWTKGMPMKMLHGKSSYLYRPTYRTYRPNHFGPPAPPPTPRYAYPSENYHRPTYGSSKGSSYSESPSYSPVKHEYTETQSHQYLPPIYETSSGSTGSSGSSNAGSKSTSNRYSSKPILPYSKYPSGSYSKDTESHNYYTNTPASIGYHKKVYHASLSPPASYSTVRPNDEASYASYDGAGMLSTTGNEYDGPSGGSPIEEQLGSYDAQERYKGA